MMADANTIQDAVQNAMRNQFIAGLIAVGVLVIVPLVKDLLRDRRERQSDELKQTYLKSIAESNERMATRQGELNVLLQTSIGVGNARHEQNLEASKHICKWGEYLRMAQADAGATGVAILGQPLPKFEQPNQRDAGQKEKGKT